MALVAALVITSTHFFTPKREILNKLGWSNLKQTRNKQKALMMLKLANRMPLSYLKNIFSAKLGVSAYNLTTSQVHIAIFIDPFADTAAILDF